jgi:hypothetical protein
MQVLITSDETPVGGYDAVLADPDGLVAKRYGLRDGGRVVVRPDGYIGAVTELDDQMGVADYFAQIRRWAIYTFDIHPQGMLEDRFETRERYADSGDQVTR